MKDEKMVASFDGTELRLRKDLVPEPKALIVIAHGLCEHLNRYDHFTERLNEQGTVSIGSTKEDMASQKGTRSSLAASTKCPMIPM